MEKIALLFGSSTGNTENVAEMIADKIGNDQVDLLNVAECSVDDIQDYKNIIIGVSTWGVGDLQDDWDEFLADFENSDLEGKTIALYGLGDCESYSDSFVDAMGTIYESIKDKNCKIVGSVDVDGYNFEESKAVVDGNFVGLPLDEDNEGDLTESRLDAWLNNLTTLLQ